MFLIKIKKTSLESETDRLCVLLNVGLGSSSLEPLGLGTSPTSTTSSTSRLDWLTPVGSFHSVKAVYYQSYIITNIFKAVMFYESAKFGEGEMSKVF